MKIKMKMPFKITFATFLRNSREFASNTLSQTHIKIIVKVNHTRLNISIKIGMTDETYTGNISRPLSSHLNGACCGFLLSSSLFFQFDLLLEFHMFLTLSLNIEKKKIIRMKLTN